MNPGHGRPPGRPWRAWRRLAVAAAVAVVGLAACGGAEPADEQGAASPTAAPSTPAPGPPAPAPAPEPVEFRYRAPDPVCPPASALTELPLADRRPYALVDPFLDETDHFFLACTYRRAELDDDAPDTILEQHANLSVLMSLYREPADAWLGNDLPLESSDLAVWVDAALPLTREPEPEWEGCALATPCEEGQEPLLRSYRQVTSLDGRVGNLTLRVHVIYVAESLPGDVERRAVAMFREFVLAMVDHLERID